MKTFKDYLAEDEGQMEEYEDMRELSVDDDDILDIQEQVGKVPPLEILSNIATLLVEPELEDVLNAMITASEESGVQISEDRIAEIKDELMEEAWEKMEENQAEIIINIIKNL